MNDGAQQSAADGGLSDSASSHRSSDSAGQAGHLSDTELAAFATGKLDDIAADRTEEHLQHCDVCGTRLDQLIRSDSLVERLRARPELTESDISRSADSTIEPGSSGRLQSREISSHGIGKALHHHRLIAILGSGGMGVVYRAHDSLIGRDVAIKVLHETVARDPDSRARFLAEARAQGRLNHVNVVTIYGIDELDSTMYIAMELVPGGSMADRLDRSGPLSCRDATRALMQACRGLSAAHTTGLIHRDVKPENLLVDDLGDVKLGDFGLAKAPDAASLTRSNHMVGPPHFMSPEQCRCEPVDARSDIYQLGATYYKLLTGANPYPQAKTPFQAINAHCNYPVPDPREIDATIPDDCAAIVMQAMAKDADHRYQSADEAFSELLSVHDSLPETPADRLPTLRASDSPTPLSNPSNPRPKVALFALFAVAALAVLAFVNRGPSRPAEVKPGDNVESPIAASDDNPVKVGILHSLSGTMADSEAPVVDAAMLAIDELNAAGGLLGRPLQPIVADGRSDPDEFATQAARLITEEKVSVVFGCWTSASRKTVVPVFERLNHLLIYPVQYEGLEQSRNVIYLGAAPNQQIIPAVKWAFAFANKRRFFLVGSDYVFPRTANEIIRDELDQLGAELVGEEYLMLGATDAAPLVNAIVQAKPDVILNTINGDSNVAFFRALRAAGITPRQIPTISFSFGEVELKHLDVGTMVGDYACWTYFQAIDDPVNVRFVERFQKKYGPQRVISDPMEAAYFGVKLWAQAVLDARSVEPAAALETMKGLTFLAPQGTVSIDPVTQHTHKTPRIGRVNLNGQFDLVWESSDPLAPTPFPSSRSRTDWQSFHDELFEGWGKQWSAPQTRRVGEATDE